MRISILLFSAGCGLLLVSSLAQAQNVALDARIAQLATQEEPKVIAWRRDIHEHPELGNQEIRTAAIIAKYLLSLGMEVKTGVAVTGVVGILKGDKPGPVIALRADMDALPVKEDTGKTYASKKNGMISSKQLVWVKQIIGIKDLPNSIPINIFLPIKTY